MGPAFLFFPKKRGGVGRRSESEANGNEKWFWWELCSDKINNGVSKNIFPTTIPPHSSSFILYFITNIFKSKK